jgi:hypothetical protein
LAAAEQTATGGMVPLLHQLQIPFPEVSNSSKVLLTASHGVKHHLITSGLPIASKFCRLDGEKLAAVRQEFE